MSGLHRGMCQLEKQPANEITELLALTECKQDLQQRTKRKEKNLLPQNRGASAAA